MEIALKNRQQFISILNGYTISETQRQALQKIPLVLLAGITGSGKNAIMHRLSETGDFHVVVSDTTRPPRNGEQNGREYWFRTEEDILADLQAGTFIEAALVHNQQISGTNSREFEQALLQNQIAVNEVDVSGVATFVHAKPDTTVIFIIPPSVEVWQQRLQNRGQMSAGDFRNRLMSSLKEIKTALKEPYYHFVINDNLDNAVQGVRDIATGTMHDEHKEEGRAAAEQLLKKIETMV